MLNDVTLDGTDLQGFAEAVVDDDITVGRAGILVDHPAVEANTTRAAAEANNIRPFMKAYMAEQIFNWKVQGKDNAQVLTEVRLWEWVEIQGEKEFDIKTREQIRVLDFNEDGQYRQRVFIKKEGSADNREEWVQDGDDIIPRMNNEPLDRIPFFFVGVKSGTPSTDKPPLIDLANANLSHYTTTADLEHGAHFTALPTAVITGFTENEDKDDEFRIGGQTAWVFPDPEANVFFLEFQGKGLDTLEQRLTKKEEYMAFLGALMLAADKNGVEATETVQIRHLGETSVLSSLAQSASQSIENALQFMSEWAGFGDADIEFNLNNDFLAVSMSAQELTALLATWQAGGIAFADFLDNLKRGEIVREERTEEDIRSEIETDNPFTKEDMNDNVG